MSETITSVTLTAADYDDVYAVWESSGLHIRPVGRDSREAFAAQLATGCQFVLGLRAAQQLVAVIVLTTDSRRGWINRLAVLPDYRRHGLGLRLVQEAEHLLRDELGLPVISAHIMVDNHASQALFLAAGYHKHDDVVYFSKRDSLDA